jgi:ArsR family transcriptional regulator
VLSSAEPNHASDADLEQLVSLFRLLSDKTRLSILLLLAGGERNVTRLCQDLKLPQPTVSHHLGLLKMSNVLGSRRNGKQIFYALNGRVDRATLEDLRLRVGRCSVQIMLHEEAAGLRHVADGATAAAHPTHHH